MAAAAEELITNACLVADGEILRDEIERLLALESSGTAVTVGLHGDALSEGAERLVGEKGS